MSFRLQTRYFLYITLISLSSKYFANLTLMSILIFPCLYLLFADGRSEDVTEIQNWNDCEKLSLNCGRRVLRLRAGYTDDPDILYLQRKLERGDSVNLTRMNVWPGPVDHMLGNIVWLPVSEEDNDGRFHVLSFTDSGSVIGDSVVTTSVIIIDIITSPGLNITVTSIT